VALTAKGRSLVDAVTVRRRQEIARIMSEIPVEQQAILVQALGRLAWAAGEVPEQDWTTGWDL
jgi:DNA-binding MarR family transcriptional regulator